MICFCFRLSGVVWGLAGLKIRLGMEIWLGSTGQARDLVGLAIWLGWVGLLADDWLCWRCSCI